MGMSASQARFLCLTARKNNVEFEGQQINQQRTTLSNESASYYSELCNMSVPVPPSIDDYTRVSYTFNDGAMTNTVTSLLFDKNSTNKLCPYRVNYIQSWNDDYSIVPASSSLVQEVTDGSGNKSYNIAETTLRILNGSIPADGTDEYYDSLSPSQKQDALETEKYYKALLQEDGYGDDFYVRYIKNTTSGQYVPYFYEKNTLESATATDRNLKSVPCYTLGTTTKTREVLNQICGVEQDQSGRYVALIFGAEEGVRQVETLVQDGWKRGPLLNEGEMIDNPARNEWLLNHKEPDINDEKYTILVDEIFHYETDYNNIIGQHQVGECGTGVFEETISVDSNDQLTIQFLRGSQACYDNVISGDREECYLHVLAHILTVPDCVVNGGYWGSPSAEMQEYYNNGAGIPFTTTLGSSISVTIDKISESAIYGSTGDSGDSPLLIPIRKAVIDGNYTYADGTTYPTLFVVDDIDDYKNIGKKINYQYNGENYTINNDYAIDTDDPNVYNLLSDTYIKNPGATDAQKLLSNYYMDNGTVKLKSIKQKAIDLYYALENKSSLDIQWLTLKPFVETFQYDLMHYSLNVTQSEIMEPVYEYEYGEKKVIDQEGGSYQDENSWRTDYDDWLTELNTYPEQIPAAPVYGPDEPNMVLSIVDQSYVDPGKRVPLTVITQTDEEAYNDAMNDYYYQQHEYDHKIQEINAKLKILQLQDKQLELKLKQLDTEENAISTEIDAVKKVISKNIDSSFKTFNA